MNNTIFFLALFICLSAPCYAQTEVVSLTENLVLTESMAIGNDTRIEGNGFSIICESCDPVIKVENGSTLHLVDVMFPRTYRVWLRVETGGAAYWNSDRMRGHLFAADQE